MSDIPENQEINMDDINFDEFENFSTSEDVAGLENIGADFDTTEFENMTFDEQSNGETGAFAEDASTDFSFDKFGDDEIAAMFEGDENKQEPYFESYAEDNALMGENLTDVSEVQDSGEAVLTEEVVDEPVMAEEYVQEEFVSEPVVTEDVDEVGAYSVISPNNSKYIQWYSGNSEDEMFEFEKTSESADFTGTENCNTIHVNVGYDTYGWNVQFSDGVVMSLRDVREYQIRNGKLPNNSGRIIYGKCVLSFDNVERIVVYEAVKYFSYGI